MAISDLRTHGSSRPFAQRMERHLALIFVVLAGLFAARASLQFQAIDDLKVLHERIVRSGQLITEIKHLDEVLTMSARQLATTGEPRWRERYEQHAPLLEQMLAETQRILGPPSDASLARLRSANDALLAMEQRVISASTAERLDEARAILDENAYAAEKHRYQEALGELSRLMLSLESEVEQGKATVSRRLRLGMVGFILMLLLLQFIFQRTLTKARTRMASTEELRDAARRDAILAMTAGEVCVLRLASTGPAQLSGNSRLLAPSEASEAIDLDRPVARERLLLETETLLRLNHEDNDPGPLELMARARNGRWLLIRGKQLVVDGARSFEGAVVDVSERVEAERSLAALTRDLEQRVTERSADLSAALAQARTLAAQLTRVEQLERRRLASLLHDDLQQTLAAARFMTLSNERTDAVALLDEAIATTRTLSHAISGPTDGARLRDNLESLCHHFSARYHVTFQFEDLSAGAPEPSAIVRDEAYAALRELLFNVVKHAGVESARVSFSVDDAGRLIIIVNDRGRGLVAGAEGLGLPSVRARLAAVGAELTLSGQPAGGTTATIRLPANESPLAAAS